MTKVSGGQTLEPNSSGTLNVLTTCQYDPMDSLVSVVQDGQSRSFTYDSLSRLTREIQPESGATDYAYNSDSLVTSRTDARNVTTSYALYDALHRVGQITYSDGTPAVAFSYDAYSTTTPVNYDRGRRTSMSDGPGSSTFRYDSMGRISTLIRTTNGKTLTGNYAYNRAGGLASAAYPGVTDGPGGAPLTVYFGYDNTGRQVSARYDNTSLSQQMVGNRTFSYSSTGATEVTSFGNGTTETVAYNNRLQPASRATPGILSLTYGYNRTGDGKNNGNVQSISDNIMPTWDQTFTYDRLNRVATSTGPDGKMLTFSYDRWGNKSQTSTAGGPHKPLTFDPASNRILTSGFLFDAAGNMKNEPADAWTGRGAVACQFDGENRIKSATVGAATATYAYDGDGNRVQKVSGGQTRLYFHDPLGAAWEYTTLWETFNLRFAGRLAFTSTAAMTPNKVWVYGDNLGTPRVKANEFGSVISGTRTVFFPFGEQYNAVSDPIKYKFAGKERDPESMLDFFNARYYAPGLGRFMSPDPGNGWLLEDPQRWNAYSYSRNNPVLYTDPDGTDVRICVAGRQDCFTLTDDEYRDLLKAQQGQQGITLPEGQFPSGDILCGSQKCGSVRYFEPGLEDDYIFLAVVSGAAGAIRAGFRALLGAGAREAAKDAAAGAARGMAPGTGETAAGQVLAQGTKAAAKQAMEGLANDAQKAALKTALGRGANTSEYLLERLADGSVRITTKRLGADGYQAFEKVIDASGVTKSVIQKAYDAAGRLVHIDQKFP